MWSGLFCVFLTILFTVYGQLMIKWQMNKAGQLPAGVMNKFFFLFHALLNFWVISAFFAAFLAALAWMSAMTKLDLNFAYPFMSLSFVFVLIFSVLFLHEPVSIYKLISIVLIIAGIVVLGLGG